MTDVNKMRSEIEELNKSIASMSVRRDALQSMLTAYRTIERAQLILDNPGEEIKLRMQSGGNSGGSVSSGGSGGNSGGSGGNSGGSVSSGGGFPGTIYTAVVKA